MNARIESIQAMEILDSRGTPTLRVFVTVNDGVRASSSVPSGASTGENEAVERATATVALWRERRATCGRQCERDHRPGTRRP